MEQSYQSEYSRYESQYRQHKNTKNREVNVDNILKTIKDQYNDKKITDFLKNLNLLFALIGLKIDEQLKGDSSGTFQGYQDLVQNIHKYQEIQNDPANVAYGKYQTVYYYEEDDIKIAQWLLMIREEYMYNYVIRLINQNECISIQQLKDALQQFVAKCYELIFIKTQGKYNKLIKTPENLEKYTNGLEKEIDTILGISTETKQISIIDIQKITSIRITDQIKITIRQKTEQKLNKIQEFREENYKYAGLHKKDNKDMLKNQQDQNGEDIARINLKENVGGTANVYSPLELQQSSKNASKDSKQEWSLYVGILIAAIVVVVFGFVIYHEVNKNKLKEEEEDNILIKD